MNPVQKHPYVALAVVGACFMVAATVDFRVQNAEAQRTVVYRTPNMEAPCRDPVPEKELRIWIDKRLSATEGVRTCRVIPISGDDSPKKAMKMVLKL